MRGLLMQIDYSPTAGNILLGFEGLKKLDDVEDILDAFKLLKEFWEISDINNYLEIYDIMDIFEPRIFTSEDLIELAEDRVFKDVDFARDFINNTTRSQYYKHEDDKMVNITKEELMPNIDLVIEKLTFCIQFNGLD